MVFWAVNEVYNELITEHFLEIFCHDLVKYFSHSCVFSKGENIFMSVFFIIGTAKIRTWKYIITRMSLENEVVHQLHTV